MSRKSNGKLLQDILTQMATLTERIDNVKEDTQELKIEVKKINGLSTEVKVNRERIRINRTLFWAIFVGILGIALKVLIF